MALFNREYELLVGEPDKDGILITGLRVTFSARLSHGKASNTATFRVYNLSRTHTTAIMSLVNGVVRFRCGYTGQVGTLFIGDLNRAVSYLDGVDRVLELDVRDSMIALRDSKTSLSVPKNTSARIALQSVAANFGLPLQVKTDALDRQLPKGFAFTGRTRNALTELCTYLGLEWSAQQGEIMVIDKGGTFSSDAVVLSPQSGLIGSPKPIAKSMTSKQGAKLGIKYGQDGVRRYTETDPNAKMKTRQMLEVDGFSAQFLMNTAIVPGAIVKLVSQTTGGADSTDTKSFFRVEEVNFEGDSHGGGWGGTAQLQYPSQGTAKKEAE